jgi:polyisoprenoid-binding protein YceI
VALTRNAVTLCPTKIDKFMKPFTLVLALISVFVLSANAADTFKVDPVHASVVFSVQHLGITNFYGRFNDISGTVVFDRENSSKSSVELSVPVESLDTHNAKREQSLKSPDYFDAKQFPTITFKSTKVEGSGDTLKVSGDLTIHGVTKPLTVDFKKGGEGKGLFGEMRGGGETRFTIKRSDFGMNFQQGAIGDEVTIILSLEGIKQ